jgi:undecaprenyl-diphosphatase
MQNSDRPVATTQALLAGLAVVSAIGFVLLALAVTAGPLAIDTTVADWLRPARLGLTGVVVDALNLLGQALLWDALVLAVSGLLWWRGMRFAAVLLLAGVITAEASASVTKVVIGRERPPGVEVVDLITQASFPSGHMTRAVVTGGLLAAIAWPNRRWRLPAAAGAAVFAGLMGAARIAVGEHWFTDVVGAALFGLMALAIIGLIAVRARPWFERRVRGSADP